MKRWIGVLAVALVAWPASAATVKRLDGGALPVVRAPELTVSIDVKDAEVQVILKELKKQCRVKNLMIDPQVNGSGTFYFRDVPCRQAWSIVLRSMGFDAATYPNSVVTVGADRKR